VAKAALDRKGRVYPNIKYAWCFLLFSLVVTYWTPEVLYSLALKLFLLGLLLFVFKPYGLPREAASNPD
jgi:hypothetical protein